MTICVGFDPGGKNAFGWAVIDFTENDYRLLNWDVTSSAGKAVTAAALEVGSRKVCALGVDAPLYWLDAADRTADKKVREMVLAKGGSSGTVAHVNSLRGACLVQGVIVALKAKEMWPKAILTEAHPKALLRISDHARRFLVSVNAKDVAEHVRDAALAAYSAYALYSRREKWVDLALFDSKAIQPVGPVAYYFPRGET